MKKKSDQTLVDIQLNLELPLHFCLTVVSEKQAQMVKSILDLNLMQNPKSTKYEYYRISPMNDITFYFHAHNELDLPDQIDMFTFNSFFEKKSAKISKKDLLYRSDNDKFNELKGKDHE